MSIRAALLFSLSLLFSALSFAQATADQASQIQSHSAQAALHLRDNRKDLAAAEFSAIVAMAPDNVEAQSNLGVLLFFQGDYLRAAPHLRAAWKLQPESPRIQALLGMCEKRNGDVKLAESDLSESFPRLRDERIRIQAGVELAEIYYAAHQPEKAASIVPVLRALRPEDPNILYLAYRLYSELARESALGIASFAPDSARMQQVMAEELARQGKYPEAIAHFREALKADPQIPGVHFELAELLNVSGDAAAAETEYRAALAANPVDARSESRLGELALRATDVKTASFHFAAALRLQPDDVDTCVGMAKVFIASNEPAQALPLLERAVRFEPLDSAIHYQLGLVYRRLGRTADSRRELEQFNALKDSNTRLKRLYRQMGLQPNPGRPEQSSESPAQP